MSPNNLAVLQSRPEDRDCLPQTSQKGPQHAVCNRPTFFYKCYLIKFVQKAKHYSITLCIPIGRAMFFIHNSILEDANERIGQKLLRGRGGGGEEGSDICSHEKPKKFDPPQTFGQKIVILPKTIPKKCGPPLEIQWQLLLKHKETFRDVNNLSGELPVRQLGLQVVLAFSFRNRR